MATQILRTVDRWRFEGPLALALAGAAGFAALAMPHDLFARLPVVGAIGMPAHVALAVLLAIVCGGAGYFAMRRPAKVVPADDDAEAIDDLDAPSGLSEDRLLRLRRADRHPDAPPRAPIRASRDLGEPFMDVGAFAEPREPLLETDGASTMIAGDYIEIEESIDSPVGAEAAPGPVDAEPKPEPEPEPEPETVVEVAAAADVPGESVFAQRGAVDDDAAVAVHRAEDAAPAPIARPVATAPRDTSIVAMMDRLSAGIERRAGRPIAPTRDMRPALRDALDELNRLAARRG